VSAALVPLHEIAEVKLGRQRSPKDHDGDHMRPYVRAANVGWGGWKLDDVKSMNFTDTEMQTYRLEPGDILLGEASGSASEVGKPALWDGEIEDCAFQNTLIRVRPRDPEPRYLLHYFRHCAASGTFARQSRGVGIFHLGRKALAEWLIPLPPIEEQRRIAAVLDVADELRTKRRQAIAKLDTLTQAIFIDMFGDPLKLDDKQVGLLGDITDFVGGGTPSKSRPDYFVGDICWATSKDMRQRFLEDTQDHVTPEAIAASATKLVPPGTVLVVVKSKILAHTLPVVITRVPTCFGQDLKGLRPREGISAEFVASCLRSGDRWLLRRARGVNTEGLTLEQLRRTPVPLASTGAIDRFTEAAQSVEARRAGVTKSVNQADNLFASLQQRAFRGEL
jgi:type I restriction enzyme S subunit